MPATAKSSEVESDDMTTKLQRYDWSCPVRLRNPVLNRQLSLSHMPSSTLQARIKAFEAIGSGASKDVLDTVAIHTEPEHLLDRPHSPSAASIPPIVPTTFSPPASPTSLQHRTSLLDLKDWVIDDGPLGASPTTAILTGYSPLPVATPLLHESAPLISFEGSPPKFVRAPPLPPRKLSLNSPRSVSAPAASPTTSPSNNMLMPPSTDSSLDPSPSDSIRRAQGHMHASSVSSFHSVSLSSDGDDSATPGALHAFPIEREWTGTGTEDGESLDESFENVSAPSSFLPPPSFPPRPPLMSPGKPVLALATKQPPPPPPLPSQTPKLPQRPTTHPRGPTNSFASHSSSPSPVTSGIGTPVLTRNNSPSSSSHSHQSTRRIPPPPPPSAAIAIPSTNAPLPRSRPPSARISVQSTATTSSDRSSLFSQGTTTSRSSISSRMTSVSAIASTPTPATGTKQVQAARVRYDALFSANVRAHAPKPPLLSHPVPVKRQNAGWRGLSIDVPPPIPASPTPPGPALSEPGPEARLDGRLVREIWVRSRLEPQRLRGIWCVSLSSSSSSVINLAALTRLLRLSFRNECDPDGTGSLDRDAFVRGMTRIDEELRRVQLLGRARARPVPSRPILR